MTPEEYSTVIRWDLAEATGWSFEHIDALSLADIGNWLAIKTGRSKIEQDQAKSKKR